MKLIDALGKGQGKYSMKTIIGSGGKTSTLYRLGEEFVEDGNAVLLTTTTAMRLPRASQKIEVIIEENIKALYEYLLKLKGNYQVFAAKTMFEEDKVKGYEVEELAWLHRRMKGTKILVEGDGSKGKSLKIPAPWEPQIPEPTDLTIVVVGWDILNKPLEEKWIHRCHLLNEGDFFNDRSSLPKQVDEEVLLALLENPMGLMKGIPQNSSVVLLLNKVMSVDEQRRAQAMADEVLKRIPRIKRVVFGEVKRDLMLRKG